jgi:spore coat protein U-like protein
MSTKKETKTVNQYNSGSMNAFNALTPAVQQNWLNDMQLDFTKSKTFNLALQQGVGAAAAGGQRMVQNLGQNLLAGGFAGANLGGVQLAQLAKIGRATSANQSNVFLQNALHYDQMRRQTAAIAGNYKPLQTGQTTTEKTSGLGTWLPQVIGGGLQAAMAFGTGGASLAASGAAKAGGSAFNLGASQLAAGGAAAANPLLSRGNYDSWGW